MSNDRRRRQIRTQVSTGSTGVAELHGRLAGTAVESV
ncbi:MAG: hypothetical protein J07HX64_02605 [halophilic archaeon J07HX64]|nr:MAG: hypothetical protein J07HX64_02605 [halophilic archaeon J07HX64]